MSLEDDFPYAGYKSSRPYGRGPSSPRKATSSIGGPPCPTCGSRNSTVVDSRVFDGGQRRRRKCNANSSCERWNTYETNLSPEELKQPELSVLDKNRIIRSAASLQALMKSLDLKE